MPAVRPHGRDADSRISNQAATATLTFNEPHRELVKGMAVTGPGLDNAHTEKGCPPG